MKRFANNYHDGKIKSNKIDGLYYYQDKENYLFSRGIYKTKIKEADLPDYFVKVWQYPRYKFIALKEIKYVYYRPSFFTNHRRKDDLLFISYNKDLALNEREMTMEYDEIINGPEIDSFIDKLEKYGYDKNRIEEIKKLIDKKDKWYKYWNERNWKGNYSYTTEEIWIEILGDKN